ncbi:discoidin domain-containing protein [Nocardia sp. NPDC057440]|uniref:discoidin domain-containing protein n=1 Tax=Nocardia sp. NPDC057440 TaxID=3346134 RepID=UPI003670DA6C
MTIVQQYTATTSTEGAVSNISPLYFDLNTTPDPVRVSPASGDPQRANFVLVGSRRSTTAIECRKITVTVPTGNNSPDLTPDLTSATAQISLPGWTPSTNTATKTITFTPTSGYAEIGRDQGVTVQLMGMRINTEIGSAPLKITLSWREPGYTDPEDGWEDGITIFDVGKFPPDFHMANFMAEQLIIDNSDSVKLNWEASGVSSLRLIYDAADINVLNEATYTVNNVDHTTVFYLRATVQVGTNTVERTLSVTVTVRVPDLEVRNFTVLGEFIMPAVKETVSVTPNLGELPQYPATNMLDGNLETYYLSNGKAEATGSEVALDLGSLKEINSLHVYFGTPGSPPSRLRGMLATSPDNSSWEIRNRFQTLFSNEVHEHFPEYVPVRYVRLIFMEASQDRIAIRSFQVGPSLTPVRITREAAEFGVPVTAHRGITDR